MAATREPTVVIRVPTEAIGLSLSKVMNEFGGERGMNLAKGNLAVVHYEFPRDVAGLGRLLEAVRLWLPEVGMDEISVESNGEVYRVDAGRPINVALLKPVEAERATSPGPHGRLYWKYEDGPENGECSDANDIGPAWIDVDGDSEAVAGGDWVTRAEARRLARANGYLLEEDG